MLRVFNLGLPRCGTNTLTKALTRAGLEAYHTHCSHRSFGGQIAAGWRDDGDPLSKIPHNVEAILHPSNGANWPQMDYDLVEHLRDKTIGLLFLLPTRLIRDHVASFTYWGNSDGSFRDKLVRKDLPGLPAGAGKTDSELGGWIARHYFSLELLFGKDERLVKFDISDPAAPEIIGNAIGEELPWWGTMNARNRLPKSLER